MKKIKILVFSGSARIDSLNKKLAKLAAAELSKAGAEVTYLDLRDYSIPLYDGDIEAESGIPVDAIKFREILKAHDAALIASPEYNSSYPPLLKNVIDWASRPDKNEKPLVAFAGKTMALVSASPSALGGTRGLVQLKSLLGNIQVMVIPEQLAVSAAHEAFDENGSLKDEKKNSQLKTVAKRLVSVASKLVD